MGERLRLQKYFTDCGVLSRRAAEAEIEAGRVLVNGVPAKLGDKIDPDLDRVEYRGKRILPRKFPTYRYLMLHKPRGYLTTAKDDRGRRTVLELMKNVNSRVYPVGRLDIVSEGLLLLTDDGEFANHLTHPRHEIPKIYRVKVSPAPSAEQLHALAQPMELDGYRLLPIGVRPSAPDELMLTLHEGRNRQIRRMCDAVGLRVLRLQRVAIGKVTLSDLPIGKWRELTPDEVTYLYNKDNK